MGRTLRWGSLQLCQSLVNGLYKESNYNPRFWEKISAPLWGIFNNSKEKLSFLRVQTAALIESQATAP